MKINWKLRLKNKTTLSTLIAMIAAIVYQVLGWFGIIPKVPITEVLNAVSILLEALALLGIIVDPTTKGVNDSDRAMSYETPSEGSIEDKPELPDEYYEPEKTEEELMNEAEEGDANE